MRCAKYIEGIHIYLQLFLQWPRLTALFHLDNGVESDVHENGRYETTFQEPPTSEPFYKFYLHPDDIARGRSVSQYSMQNAGREGANGSSVCNYANIRMFLGTVLLFSLAGIVAVAVTLAVLCEYMCCYIVYKA